MSLTVLRHYLTFVVLFCAKWPLFLDPVPYCLGILILFFPFQTLKEFLMAIPGFHLGWGGQGEASPQTNPSSPPRYWQKLYLSCMSTMHSFDRNESTDRVLLENYSQKRIKTKSFFNGELKLDYKKKKFPLGFLLDVQKKIT